MAILSLEDFKSVPDGYKQLLLGLYIGYTLILGGIISTIVKNLEGNSTELNCDNWTSAYYTNATNAGGDNEMTFYLNYVAGSGSTLMCTAGTTDLIESYGISPFTTLCGTGIFAAYLVHGIFSLLDGLLLREELQKSEGGISPLDNMLIGTIAISAAIQMLFVEIGGLSLISNSATAVDLLINSSATIFLAEVDDVVAEIILRQAVKAMKIKVTLEYCGIEFEHDPTVVHDPNKVKVVPVTPVANEVDDEAGSAKASE